MRISNLVSGIFLFLTLLEAAASASPMPPKSCAQLVSLNSPTETRTTTVHEATYDSFKNINAAGLIDSGTVLRVLDKPNDKYPKTNAPRQLFWTLQNRIQDPLLVDHVRVLSYLSYDSRLASPVENDFKNRVMAGISHDQLERLWSPTVSQFYDSYSFVEVNLVVVKVKGQDQLYSYYDTSGKYLTVETDVTMDAGSFANKIIERFGVDNIEYVANFHTHPGAHIYQKQAQGQGVPSEMVNLKFGFMAAATSPDFSTYKEVHRRAFSSLPRLKQFSFAVAFTDSSGSNQIILSEYGFNIDATRFSSPSFLIWDW